MMTMCLFTIGNGLYVSNPPGYNMGAPVHIGASHCSPFSVINNTSTAGSVHECGSIGVYYEISIQSVSRQMSKDNSQSLNSDFNDKDYVSTTCDETRDFNQYHLTNNDNEHVYYPQSVMALPLIWSMLSKSGLFYILCPFSTVYRLPKLYIFGSHTQQLGGIRVETP